MKLEHIKISNLATQFMQYGVIGGIAFLADFGIMVGLTEWGGINYLISAMVSFLFGLIVNYSLCVNFVFNERKLSSRQVEFLAFSLIGIGGLALNISLIGFLAEFVGIRYTVAKLIAAFFVLLFNFVLRRQFLFTKALNNQINSPIDTNNFAAKRP